MFHAFLPPSSFPTLPSSYPYYPYSPTSNTTPPSRSHEDAPPVAIVQLDLEGRRAEVRYEVQGMQQARQIYLPAYTSGETRGRMGAAEEEKQEMKWRGLGEGGVLSNGSGLGGRGWGMCVWVIELEGCV